MPTAAPASELDADGVEEPAFKRLSAEEAQALLARQPRFSPWRVLAWQAVAGGLVVLVVWFLTQSPVAGWSAAYGALAVLVPAALFIRGLSRQRGVVSAGSALVGFFAWEMVKIALTVAMLLAAPRWISQLNWLALLAGFVVTMKVCWVAVWLRPARAESVSKI